MKKIMFLGGIRYLLPAIKRAKHYGCHVITADYLPDNVAHAYSDEYVNVSILDKEAVLNVAREKQIDAILSFGVDPGVVSAAYTAETLGLPFQCSYQSACILQDKSLFRKFLSANGFNCPMARSFSSLHEALDALSSFQLPIIVKPVDSAGSKGVSMVNSPDHFVAAFQNAFSHSHNGNVIVEDYLQSDGSPSGGECFFVNGILKYTAFYDQTFDTVAPNPFVPVAECWPSNKPDHHLRQAADDIQRLGTLLHFRTGLFNVEWRISSGKLFIMELSPRAGGNRLAEILNYATDVDIIDAEIRQSLGLPCNNVRQPLYNGCYAIYNIHSDRGGIIDRFHLDPDFEKKYVVEKEYRGQQGHPVNPFSGANNSIGTLFLRTNSRSEMDALLTNINRYVALLLK